MFPFKKKFLREGRCFPLVFKQRYTTVKWYLDMSHDGAGTFPRKSQRREQPWTEQTHSQPALLQRLETRRLFVRLTPGFCKNQDRRGSCRPGFPLISGSDRRVVSAGLGTGRVLITSGACMSQRMAPWYGARRQHKESLF